MTATVSDCGQRDSAPSLIGFRPLVRGVDRAAGGIDVRPEPGRAAEGHGAAGAERDKCVRRRRAAGTRDGGAGRVIGREIALVVRATMKAPIVVSAEVPSAPTEPRYTPTNPPCGLAAGVISRTPGALPSRFSRSRDSAWARIADTPSRHRCQRALPRLTTFSGPVTVLLPKFRPTVSGNGQRKHDGASHKPDEFDVMNPCANERRTRTRSQALSGPDGNQVCGNNPMRLDFG